MQAQDEINKAVVHADSSSIFDLPSEDDDESIPLDDLIPRKYDAEGGGGSRWQKARETEAGSPPKKA